MRALPFAAISYLARRVFVFDLPDNLIIAKVARFVKEFLENEVIFFEQVFELDRPKEKRGWEETYL